jgi:transcriptional regulator with XRE-family HTH domain
MRCVHAGIFPEGFSLRNHLGKIHFKVMKKPYSPKNPRRGRPTNLVHSAPAQLRELTGLTQDQFAALCGINRETYRSIERKMNTEVQGEPWISDYHAEQIALVTGVDADALRLNRLICLDGRTPYKRKDWQAYRAALREGHQRLTAYILNEIKVRMLHVVDIAEDLPATGPLLWYTSLAIELDRFFKDRKALLFRNSKELPPLISRMCEWARNEVAREAVGRTVAADKLRRPTRPD